MILQLQIQNKQRKYPVRAYTALMEDAILKTLAGERISAFIEKNRIQPVFSILFVNNEGIRQMNLEFRGLDCPTDVLSFPQLETKTQTRTLTRIDRTDLFINRKGQKEAHFGDIVLSLKKANEQAVAYGHSMEREVSFLTVHSVLHLLGYDHIDLSEEKRMIRKQKSIMKTLQITEMEKL